MYDAVIFTDMTFFRQSSMHLGPYKVAHMLRKQGFEVLVVNHLAAYSFEELQELIDSAITEQTKFVGFSITFMNNISKENNNWRLDKDNCFPQGREFGDRVFEYILTKNKNIKFVVGGRGLAGSESPYINYWVKGYAENSIVHLMNHLCYGTDIPKSQVLETGVVLINDPKAIGYDFSQDTMLWKNTDVVNHKVLPIETARGCIFNCKFCNFILNGKKNNDYIRNHNSLYIELLSNYENHGITHYYFADDTVNENTVKLEMLADIVNELPFKPSFWAFTRLELLCTDPAKIDLMDKIGVRAMYFGVETMHMEAGRVIGKGYSREKQIETIQYIRDNYPHISLHGSFIAGLPKEPYDSIMLTLEQLSNGEIPLHSWSMRPLFIEEFDGGDPTIYSEFDLNWQNYGYKKLSVTTDGAILWENDQGLNFVELMKELPKKVEDSRLNKRCKIPGIDSFQLVNLGYDLSFVLESPLYGFDWDEADRRTVEFIENYKRDLVNLVKNG